MKKIDRLEIDTLAENGKSLEITPGVHKDIVQMGAGMILLPEVQAIMFGEFLKFTFDPSRSYKAELEEAKRKGTLPRVEILVYGNEVVN